jgi:hypothetical protein
VLRVGTLAIAAAVIAGAGLVSWISDAPCHRPRRQSCALTRGRQPRSRRGAYPGAGGQRVGARPHRSLIPSVSIFLRFAAQLSIGSGFRSLLPSVTPHGTEPRVVAPTNDPVPADETMRLTSLRSRELASSVSFGSASPAFAHASLRRSVSFGSASWTKAVAPKPRSGEGGPSSLAIAREGYPPVAASSSVSSFRRTICSPLIASAGRPD